MKKFNVNGNIILANDAAEAVKKFKDAKIELDWASDEDAQRFAKKFNCSAKRSGSANGYPVYIFEGTKSDLEKLTKVYGMDKEDFDEFVEDSTKDELPKYTSPLKVAQYLWTWADGSCFAGFRFTQDELDDFYGELTKEVNKLLKQGYDTLKKKAMIADVEDSVKDDDLDAMIERAIKKGKLTEPPYNGNYALKVRASEYTEIEKRLKQKGYKRILTGGNPYNNYNVFFS